MNVYDNTKFDKINETFDGDITVYCETYDGGEDLLADMAVVLCKDHYPMVGYQRRLKVDYNDV